MSEDQPIVAVAGASGFVGTSLRIALSGHYRWRALTRSKSLSGAGGSHDEDNTQWQHCDLYSLPQVADALHEAKYAVYLVHSMLPSVRLVQGGFEDLDLLLADNFIRGAEEAGVEHIVYLGGLVPDEPEEALSPHLASRLEVERVLRSRSIPVTSLRAGLIFGPGGSSIRIPINLVHRLPAMIMPAWTRSTTHSIDIEDVLRAFEIVLSDESMRGGTFDLGGHDPMTYKELILRTARQIRGREPLALDAPVNFLWLSRHWVAWFSGMSAELVNPLQESLRHSLIARDNSLLQRLKDQGMVSFTESLKRCVDEDGRPLPNPRSKIIKRDKAVIREERRVQSVQRMPLPKGWDAPRVAEEYGAWLTRSSFTIISVERDEEGVIRFFWHWPRIKMLELSPTPYSRTGERRRAFYISGGILARQVDPPGRFEFRIFPEAECVVAAIHGFAPALPWYIYEYSQALIHLVVMNRFRKHLMKLGKG